MRRWGFKNSIIFERLCSRAIITEYDEHDENGNFVRTVRFVAFRGTKPQNFIEDVLKADVGSVIVTKLGPCSGTGRGFHKHLNKILNLLAGELNKREKLPLYVIGHSLGGAMSTLFLVKLKEQIDENLYPGEDEISLYSFGQPRAGIKEFADRFHNQFSKNVYIVQKHDDPVPSFLSSIWKIFGNYFSHCGSIRFIDEAGQLAGDVHYKLHDIRRLFMAKIPDISKASLVEIRKAWTIGFENLQEITSAGLEFKDTPSVSLRSCDLISEEEINELKISGGKISTQKSRFSDVFSRIITNLKSKRSPMKSHGMSNYLTMIWNLNEKIDGKMKSFKEDAISSTAATLTISDDCWDRININTKLEQEHAYRSWISNYYISIGEIKSVINNCIDTTINCWLVAETEILKLIDEFENDIINYLNENQICFEENYPSSIDKDVLLFPMSPFVCHGIECIFYLLLVCKNQKNIEARDFIYSRLRKFYYSLPEDCPVLSVFSQDEIQNNSACYERDLQCIIEVSSSPLKDGIRNYILLLSTKLNSKFIKKIHNHLETLPYKNGYRPSIVKEEKEWNELLHSLFISEKPESYSKHDPHFSVIIGDKIKKGYLNPDYKKSFENKEENNTVYGRRLVYPLGKTIDGELGVSSPQVFIKHFPELPGLERATEILSKFLIGEDIIPCSTIGRIDYIDKNNLPVSIPILISKAVGESNLQKLQTDTSVMQNLDPDIFSKLAILQILTLIEDAKSDNFQMSLDNKTGLWKLFSIDNDHCFVPAIIKNSFSKDVLNFKSILFCCDDIKKEISPEIIEQYLFINFELILEQWLIKLDKIYGLCVGKDMNNSLFTPIENTKLMNVPEKKKKSLFKAKFKSKKVNSNILEAASTIICPIFAENMVEDMYNRMIKLQNQLRSSKNSTTEALFTQLHPTVSKLYLRAFDSKKTPHERFHEITKRYYVTDDTTESNFTKTTGADVLQSAKVKPTVQYSPSKQLDIIKKLIGNDDENTKKAVESLLKHDQIGFYKEFKQLKSRYFLDKQVQRILFETQNEKERDIIEMNVCKTLLNFGGFKNLNLSNIKNRLVFDIIYRNHATIESLIVRNCIFNSPVVPSVYQATKIAMDKYKAFDLKGVLTFVLYKLKYIDVTGSRGMKDLAPLLPAKKYKIDGFLEQPLYPSNNFPILWLYELGLEHKLPKIENISMFTDSCIDKFFDQLDTNNNLKVVALRANGNILQLPINFKLTHSLQIIENCSKLSALAFSCADMSKDDVSVILQQLQEIRPNLVSLCIERVKYGHIGAIINYLRNSKLQQLIITKEIEHKPLDPLQNLFNVITSEMRSLKFFRTNYGFLNDLDWSSLKENKTIVSFTVICKTITPKLKEFIAENSSLQFITCFENKDSGLMDDLIFSDELLQFTLYSYSEFGGTTLEKFKYCKPISTDYQELFNSVKIGDLNSVKHLLTTNLSPYLCNEHSESILDLAKAPEVKDFIDSNYPLLNVLRLTKGMLGFDSVQQELESFIRIYS